MHAFERVNNLQRLLGLVEPSIAVKVVLLRHGREGPLGHLAGRILAFGSGHVFLVVQYDLAAVAAAFGV